MIDKLITALSKKVGMSTEEIADTIWLALQIQESQSESVSSDFSFAEEERETSDNKRTSQNLPPQTLDSKETQKKGDSEAQKAKIYPQSQQQTESLDLSFKTPNPPSLRQPLTLARALKPLMRRIPAGTNFVLDETATIERIANTKLWLPVLKPTLEPWLDLELVVDESISMQIWRQTIRDLEKLLKNYGIFRDVRVWGMTAKDGEKVQVRRGIGAAAKNKFPRSSKELIDGSGRRLVLVVSDCVSSYWRDGKVTEALEVWANSVPTAIIQMLPKWLWKRTALGRASEVRLRGLTPGVSNQNLIAEEVSLWEELEEERGVKIPVFTLETDKAATWAQMLSGKSSVSTLGFVFKLDAPVQENRLFNLNYSRLSAEERVQAFRVTASPMARKLAGLLAAAPVISLPVVRLIRGALLPESLQVNVAEVFLGGLLKPLSEIKVETHPDDVLYGFVDGVRELLVDSMPSEWVLQVVDKVSEYVAERVGLSLEDFAAVLRREKKVEDSGVVEEVGYFATVTAQVLRRLGGEYEKVAEELERNSKVDSQTQMDIQTNLDSATQLTFYSIRLEKETLKVGFAITPNGETIKVDGDQIVKDVAKQLDQMISAGELKGGKLLKIYGRISILASYTVAHKLGHLYEAIAVSDTRLKAYVVVISNTPDYPLGSRIDLETGEVLQLPALPTESRIGLETVEVLQLPALPTTETSFLVYWENDILITTLKNSKEVEGDRILQDAKIQLENLINSGELPGEEKLLKINGRSTVLASFFIANQLAHKYSGIAVYDPRIGYVITISNSKYYQIGQVLNLPKPVKVALCGPANTGQTVLRDSLKTAILRLESAPQDFYSISASPDGDGAFYSETAKNYPKLAEQLKAESKAKFTPEFAEGKARDIRRIKNSLLLFNVGGKTSSENQLIMSEATHAVILAKTETDVIEWQDFCENYLKKPIHIIAIIYSNFFGKEDKVERKDSILTGIVHHLERGEDVSTRPMIQALASEIVKLVESQKSLTFKKENLEKLFKEIVLQNQEIFEEVIEQELINLLIDKTVTSPEISDDNNEASITSVYEVYDIELELKRAEDDKNSLFLVRFTLTALCELSYFISKIEYDSISIEKAENISIYDSDNYYFSVESTYPINVEGIISVKKDSSQLELSRLSDDELLEFLENTDISINSITGIEVASNTSPG
ncbi:MAG: SAV_2336 N-terminal domain-related protein [Microcoleaceae cyanobacterium]